MKSRLVISFWLSCCVLYVQAQLLSIRNFTAADYNGGTQNWAIEQSDDYRMLFANNNGLLCYDGDKWDVYPVSNFTNVRSLSYNRHTRRIYVGASDEFGFFSGDSASMGLKYQSLSALMPRDRHSFGEIWKIHHVGSDYVFQATDRLFTYHINNNKVLVTPVGHDIENSTVVGGNLYVSCKDAVYKFAGGRLTLLPGTELLRGKAVRAVLPHGSGLLFVTATDGLFFYDGTTLVPYSLDITPRLLQARVFCAARNDRYMAFGTVRDGLVVKDLKNGSTLLANALTGMQNNTILSLRFDSFGNLWMGLDNGIAYALLGTPYHNFFGLGNNIGTGYASLATNGKLYMGTNQGLFAIDLPRPGEEWGGLIPFTQQPPSVSGVSGQIWSLRSVGGIVVCGANEGTYCIDGLKATRIEGLTGAWEVQELNGHPGLALACDYKGFAILKKENGGYRFQSRVEGFHEVSGNFEQDADGSVWMSQWQKGIFHFWLSSDLKRAERVEFFHSGNGLFVDENNLVCRIGGKIYISSVDGFKTYDSASRQLVKNEPMNNVFKTYGVPMRVMETPRGDLWAFKPGYLAIARRKPSGYEVDSVPYQNMVKRLQMGLGHVGFLEGGRTIFNYDNGFYAIDDHFVNDTKLGQVMVRSIYSTNNGDSLIFFAHPGNKTAQLTIPHGQNSLRLEFVMPEYRDSRAVEYTCFLENYDEQWSVPQTSTVKEYTRLSHGKYVFHVRARNLVNGLTSETRFEITVLPAWYETWWAWVFYLALAVLAVLLLMKCLKRKADRELTRVRKEKERQLREQEREFVIEREKREKELVKLQNQQLEIELKHKSSELGDSAMNLVRKNDMLQSIDNEMAELSESVRREDAKSKITKKIADIRRGIRIHMTDDDNWEKFEENFNLVYDNFTQKLTTQYPGLRRNDLKLCAYLRMGLSSKEIATLFNSSVRSIETARYRLRKKLDIDTSTNLSSFIQSIGGEDGENPSPKPGERLSPSETPNEV